MFKIKEPTPYMIELAKVLLSASQEIYLLINDFGNSKMQKISWGIAVR